MLWTYWHLKKDETKMMRKLTKKKVFFLRKCKNEKEKKTDSERFIFVFPNMTDYFFMFYQTFKLYFIFIT